MKIAIVFIIMMLSGCAVDDYARYAQMQEAIATAHSAARIAEAKAIEAIGQSGSDAAKVAAVLTLRSSSDRQEQQNVQAPKSAGDTILQWLGTLAPSVVQGYGFYANMRTNMNSADRSSELGISTNQAFVGIAGKIQAPVTPQANITTTTNLGGSGVIGNGTYSTQANPITTTTNTTNTDNHSNQNNPVTTTNPIAGK